MASEIQPLKQDSPIRYRLAYPNSWIENPRGWKDLKTALTMPMGIGTTNRTHLFITQGHDLIAVLDISQELIEVKANTPDREQSPYMELKNRVVRLVELVQPRIDEILNK